MQNYYISLIPLLPLLGFFLNGGIALQQSRGMGFVGKSLTSMIACLLPLISFALSVAAFVKLQNPEIKDITLPAMLNWMVLENFSVSFGLMVDHLTAIMLLIVTGVGSLIHIYSTGYMREDKAYARYMAYLNLFLFFMLTLVMADSLALLFVGWEGVGLCSYLLIGFWFTDKEKAQAGKKAFIVNRIGDFGFLIGIFFIVALFSSNPITSMGMENTNYLSFAFLAKNATFLFPMATIITLCLFFGATGKSAQIPLYVWLPDAMAGPTPVSALIHAATMVTAGVYMVARLHFLFAMAPLTMHIIATVGVFTAFFAALVGVTQYDIKKILAYSTVSQLGYMFLGLGVGAFSGAIFHVLTHAFFKACLFLGAGSVIHALHHEQDIRRMGGLFKKMPITAITFLICTLAIAGFPPFSGFFSKDEILYMTYANGQGSFHYWLGLITAGITAFYMMRAFVYAFLGKTRYGHPEKIHESPKVMTLPLIILTIFAAGIGFIGLPHVFGHSWIGEWLSQLGQHTPHHIEGSVLQETHLMMMSVGMAVLGSGLAFVLYSRNLEFAKSIKMKLSVLYQLIYNKFKIDELYDLCIVSPIKWISDSILFKFIDVKIIDGLMVNGTAFLSRFMGRTLAILQTGVIGHYALYLLLGLCLVLGMIVLT